MARVGLSAGRQFTVAPFGQLVDITRQLFRLVSNLRRSVNHGGRSLGHHQYEPASIWQRPEEL
jgi:hypothetical protein